MTLRPHNRPADRGILPRPRTFLLVLFLLALVLTAGAAGCRSKDGAATDSESTSSSSDTTKASGDIEGTVGEDIEVGNAVVTVRALQATFQPAMPEQRLSEQSPVAPGAGESFYQAQVRVANAGKSAAPIRVDPEDFVCKVGSTIVVIEPTRSGPAARSLLKNTSLDLLLTFKAQAGFEPVLIYKPSWYDGSISVSPGAAGETTTTATS